MARTQRPEGSARCVNFAAAPARVATATLWGVSGVLAGIAAGYFTTRGDAGIAVALIIALPVLVILATRRPPLAIQLTTLAILNPTAHFEGEFRLGALDFTNALALALLLLTLAASALARQDISLTGPTRWLIMIALLTLSSIPRAYHASSAITFAATVAMVALFWALNSRPLEQSIRQ